MTKVQSSSRNSTDARREQLIRATIKTISESGLSGATVAKVASKAGLSPGIVNFHFDSKRQLLLDTLRYIADEYTLVLNQHLGKADSPLEKLHAYIDANFDNQLFVKDKIAVWFAFMSESQAREEYREICGKSDQRENDMIRGFIAELLEPTTDSSADVDALALGLEGMIDSLWQQALYSNGSFDREFAVKTCKHYLECISPASAQKPISNGQAETVDLLPTWTYKNQEFLELEIEQLFKPNWMLVGHVSDMPNVGDYLTFEGFGEKALVIRNRKGAINAFHNICRHRGSKILEGTGQCKRALVCPFHGWRYDFDGKLQFIPGKEGFPYIEPEKSGLVALDVEIWHGFIFIRFVPGGKSLEESLTPIEHEVEHYQLERLQPYSEADHYTIPVNWKVFHDIDNEGYHVPIGHPTLHQLYGQDYIDTAIEHVPVSYGRLNSSFGELWSVKNYRKLMPDFDHLPEDKTDLWMYFNVFPNTVFALYPDMMEIYMSIPVDLENTLMISRVYALPDDRREVAALRYLNRRMNTVTDYEDRAYMKTIQEGLNSSVYPRWNLSETVETGVRDFHHKIQSVLPVGRFARQPEFGQVRMMNQAVSIRQS